MGWLTNPWGIILIALVIDQREGSDAARILGMFPTDAKSHYLMCEPLMKALAARGHQVDVVSHFPLKNPPPNYRDISLAGSIPEVTNNLTYEEAVAKMNGGVRKMFQIAGTDICSLLDKPRIREIVENPPKDPPYDVVIYELFSADCYLALGRHLKVPIVSIVSSRLFDWMNRPLGNPLSSAFVPGVFSGFSQQMTFTERLVNILESRSLQLQRWWHVSAQLASVEKHFGIKVSSIDELYKDIAVVLINTHPSFDFIRPLSPGIVEVGGLHITDGHQDLSPDIKNWLDNSKNGFVYMSFGSMVKIESFPIETIRTFYEVFERIAPVRVFMKIAKKEELPEGLPKNVMTASWLPQTRILQHKNIKIFVTHGGLMSTQEAITYGVPMINFPIFGDQYLNARLCTQRNIAITLNSRKVTGDEFTKAIKDILKNPSYSENVKRLSKLWNDRPMTPIDTAVYWVEHAMRNGNVMISPAANLSWWQVELFDVYGFIIFVLLLVLYVIKRIIGLVIDRLFRKCDTRHDIRSSRTALTKKDM